MRNLFRSLEQLTLPDEADITAATAWDHYSGHWRHELDHVRAPIRNRIELLTHQHMSAPRPVVLDLQPGCNTDQNLPMRLLNLAELLIFVDFSASMLARNQRYLTRRFSRERWRRRIRRSKNPVTEPTIVNHCLDLSTETIPLGPESVDVVTSVFGARYWGNTARIINQVANIARPGCLTAVIDCEDAIHGLPNQAHFNPHEIALHLEHRGFNILGIEEVCKPPDNFPSFMCPAYCAGGRIWGVFAQKETQARM